MLQNGEIIDQVENCSIIYDSYSADSLLILTNQRVIILEYVSI